MLYTCTVLYHNIWSAVLLKMSMRMGTTVPHTWVVTCWLLACWWHSHWRAPISQTVWQAIKNTRKIHQAEIIVLRQKPHWICNSCLSTAVGRLDPKFWGLHFIDWCSCHDTSYLTSNIIRLQPHYRFTSEHWRCNKYTFNLLSYYDSFLIPNFALALEKYNNKPITHI